MMVRAARWLAALAVIVVAVLAAPLALRAAGTWLVVNDPVEPARAVVVLGGHVPFRAMEAARGYRERWAPEVWVTRPALFPMARIRCG